MKIVYRTRWLAIRRHGVLYHTRSRKPARVKTKIPPSIAGAAATFGFGINGLEKVAGLDEVAS